jgi:hypothetical protein
MEEYETVRLECLVHNGSDTECYVEVQKLRGGKRFLIHACQKDPLSPRKSTGSIVGAADLREAFGVSPSEVESLNRQIAELRGNLEHARTARDVARRQRNEALVRAEAAERRVRELEEAVTELKPKFELPTTPGVRFRAKWKNAPKGREERLFTTYTDGKGNAIYGYEYDGYPHSRNAKEVMNMYRDHELVEE